VWLADRFGWTLDYIDGLATDEAFEVIDVITSADKAHADNHKYHGK
jgi:hypothetical protein